MPGHLHETIVKLLKDDPRVVEELITISVATPLPAHTSVVVGDADLTSVAPAKYQPDGVFIFRDDERAVFAVALEVLNNPDPEKEWALPAYWASTRERFRCPAAVLVVATNAATATFARTITRAGDPSRWSPHVVGPEEVPAVTTVDDTRERPERAVLSALLRPDDAAVLSSVLVGLLGLSQETTGVEYYLDVILARGGELARVIGERLMRPPGYEYQSDFARKYFGEGREKGREEGRHEAAKKGLETVLDTRQLSLTAEQQERVSQCEDLELLNRWLQRAVTAATTDDVFLDV